MSMHSQLEAIDTLLCNDETLLRLLYYKSKHFSDDILSETSSRPNILKMDRLKQIEIINHRIKYTPVTKDLVDNPICRIIFYPSPRKPQRGNYMVADQQIDFDIFVHRDYNDMDMRLSKICDRINDLFSNQRVTGLGKSEFVNGRPFTMANEGYIGYAMTYKFGDVNAK